MAVLGSVDSHSFPCILAGEMGQIVSTGEVRGSETSGAHWRVWGTQG